MFGKWAVCVLSLLICWLLFPHNIIAFGGILTILVAGTILWLLNILLKPVFQVLSLPLTILTLGLFWFVANAAVVRVASALIPGFQIHGFRFCLLIALLVSAGNFLFTKKLEK